MYTFFFLLKIVLNWKKCGKKINKFEPIDKESWLMIVLLFSALSLYTQLHGVGITNNFTFRTSTWSSQLMKESTCFLKWFRVYYLGIEMNFDLLKWQIISCFGGMMQQIWPVNRANCKLSGTPWIRCENWKLPSISGLLNWDSFRWLHGEKKQTKTLFSWHTLLVIFIYTLCFALRLLQPLRKWQTKIIRVRKQNFHIPKANWRATSK